MKLRFVIWIRIIEYIYPQSFFVSLKMKIVNKVLFGNAIAHSKDFTSKHTYFRYQSSSLKKFVAICDIFPTFSGISTTIVGIRIDRQQCDIPCSAAI